MYGLNPENEDVLMSVQNGQKLFCGSSSGVFKYVLSCLFKLHLLMPLSNTVISI